MTHVIETVDGQDDGTALEELEAVSLLSQPTIRPQARTRIEMYRMVGI